MASHTRSYVGFGDTRSENLNMSLDKIEEIIIKKKTDQTNLDAEIAVDRLRNIDILELIQILKILKKENGFVDLENIVLTNFLSKSDPPALHFVNVAMEFHLEKATGRKIKFDKDASDSVAATSRTAPKSQSSSISLRSKQSSLLNKTQGIGAVKLANECKVNYSVKNEFTEKLITELSKDFEEKKRNGINEIRDLLSKVNELKFRYNDIEGTICGFKQNVEISYNPKTEILPTEKFLKYFSNWLRNAVAIVSSIRLRIHTLKDNCISIRATILKKKDLSGLITSVDFEAMQLKIADYLRILEERNEHLLKIKQINGNISNSLVRSKNVINEIEIKWKNICDKSLERKNQIIKNDADTIEVENEIQLVRTDIAELSTKIENFSAPSIEEYINIKAIITQLEKIKNIAIRKKHLLQLQLKNKKQAVNIIKLHST